MWVRLIGFGYIGGILGIATTLLGYLLVLSYVSSFRCVFWAGYLLVPNPAYSESWTRDWLIVSMVANSLVGVVLGAVAASLVQILHKRGQRK